MAAPATSILNLTLGRDKPCDEDARNALNGGRIVLEEGSDVASPPLWKTSPQTKTPSLHLRPCNSHQHHRYRAVSPRRSQEIARDREKLMELIQNMPDDSYELSLKDIVDKPVEQVVERPTVIEERRGKTKDHAIQCKPKNKKASSQKNNLLRSGSMSGENVILKLFSPTSLGIKRRSNLRPCSKVSPKPRLLQGEKGVDTRWWRKRFLVDGEGKSNGSGSMVKTRSRNSSTGRNVINILPGCWSFFYTKGG